MFNNCAHLFFLLIILHTCLSTSAILCVADEPEYRYAVIRVPGFGGEDDLLGGINEAGHLVGSSQYPDGSIHPFFWDGDATISLGTFGGADGEAFDINNQGQIVGVAQDLEGYQRPFLYQNGIKFDLGRNSQGEILLLEGTANVINDAGLIGGTGQFLNGSNYQPILWEQDQIIKLPTPGARGGEVLAINEAGKLGGSSVTKQNGDLPVGWVNRKLIYFRPFRNELGRNSGVLDINEQNIAVGFSSYKPLQLKAAVWPSPSRVIDLASLIYALGGDAHYAASINESNQIVGLFINRSANKVYAYIYSAKKGAEVIDDLVPPYTGQRIAFASAINNGGQIGCTGFIDELGVQSVRVFLLTPVNPELTLTIPPGPLRANQLNTLKITNAQPHAIIKFFYGKKGGGKFLPGCEALAAMTQINDPVNFGEVVADAEGNAVLEIFVPSEATAHRGFLIQALDFENCQESQLLLKRIE